MSALHAVKPGETAPPKPPLTITEAVAAGDRLAELEATHIRIARAVENEATPARDLASLTRRQMEISKEIETFRRQRVEREREGAIATDEAWSAETI